MSPDRKRLRLVTDQVPRYESPRVFTPQIAFDDELKCFYVAPEGDSIGYQVKDLPANFHTKELLDVDPSDVESLLAFQRDWGLLTSPKRVPLRLARLGTPGDVISTPYEGMSGEEAFDKAEHLLRGLESRYQGIRSAYTELMIRNAAPLFHGAYPFAPLDEVEQVTRWLQETVERLVDAATNGYDTWANIEERRLVDLIDDIDAGITPYFPRIRVAASDVHIGKDAERPALPLTIAILAQLVGYLTSEEGYRVCPRCGRYFVFKRHTGGEYIRNRRSLYCSDECKQAESAARQARKRKAERREAKEKGRSDTNVAQ